jgi:hypothetical protein
MGTGVAAYGILETCQNLVRVKQNRFYIIEYFACQTLFYVFGFVALYISLGCMLLFKGTCYYSRVHVTNFLFE